jgi:hypothetical protein
MKLLEVWNFCTICIVIEEYPKFFDRKSLPRIFNSFALTGSMSLSRQRRFLALPQSSSPMHVHQTKEPDSAVVVDPSQPLSVPYLGSHP